MDYDDAFNLAAIFDNDNMNTIDEVDDDDDRGRI